MRLYPVRRIRRKLTVPGYPTPHPSNGLTVVRTRERTIGERINVWVQTVAIVGAGLWAFWTFFYEKVMVPGVAPANVTAQLDLARSPAGVGTPLGMASDSLMAIEMRLVATNPTARQVHLLRNTWTAYGCTITPADGLADDSTARAAVAAMINERSGFHESRHAAVTSCTLVAIGSLWRDDTLRPGRPSAPPASSTFRKASTTIWTSSRTFPARSMTAASTFAGRSTVGGVCVP